MLPKQKPSQTKLPLSNPLPQNEKWCAWEVPAPSVAKERLSKEKQLMAAHGGARAAHGESLSRNKLNRPRLPDTLSEKRDYNTQKFTRRLEFSAVLAEFSKRLADFSPSEGGKRADKFAVLLIPFVRPTPQRLKSFDGSKKTRKKLARAITLRIFVPLK